MRTLTTLLIVLLMASFTQAQTTKSGAFTSPVEVWSSLTVDSHLPYKTTDKKQFKIKGGAGGWDTLRVDMTDVDSLHILMALSDSFNIRVLGQGMLPIYNKMYVTDTTAIASGNYAGSYEDGTSGVRAFAWHQIAKTLKGCTAGMQILIYFDTDSRLESVGKYGMLYVKKYMRVK